MMNASSAKTPNTKMMVSPVYVGMQMHNARTRVGEFGSKLTARLQDDRGEVASWLVFMVTLALAVVAFAGLISDWATAEIGKLPEATP